MRCRRGLFNVLRDVMSLVGPRPLVNDEDERIEGFYRRRLYLTPGMMGPWQVPARRGSRSALRTVPVVMRRRGQ